MTTSINDRVVAAPESTCDAELAKGPWEFDKMPGYGPGASEDDVIPEPIVRPGQLPAAYQRASQEELHERILSAKAKLGEKLLILGHFYQRDEVVQYADFVGDSFQLANAALTRPDAETIVFCGVHFMAETADILARPEQRVILPNLAAGGSMADMADEDSVEACWEELTEIFGTEPDAEGKVPVVPVTYMNSSAALKAFCGKHGGIVCTSSNASTVLEWAFERGRRVLFFPDQHLGRNTAKAMGIPLEQMPMWNPRKPLGGNTEDELHDARVLLWHGFCSVHKRFTVAQIEKARAEYPGVKVIVHPECPMPVVDAADAAGSTDYIRKAAEAAEPGAVLAIGTEVNMVNRLRPSTPTRRSSVSTRSSAPARRCTASIRATSPGRSRASSTVRSATRSLSNPISPRTPKSRSSACSRRCRSKGPS
ncbi:MAG: quinolinate synthase NadA [Aeromicrobium sp.]